MKEICVLGNSHVRPLRQLVEQRRIRLPEPANFTFFVCHLNLLADLEVSGRALCPRNEDLARLFRSSSRGPSSIDIDRYDEFVITGHGFSIQRLVYLAHRYRCDSLRGPRDERYLLSDDCFSTCAARQLEGGQAMRIAGLMRGLTAKPVTIASEPNMGLGLSKSDVPWWIEPHYRAVEEGEDEALAQLFRAVCRSLADAHALRIVPPLAEIAANGLFNHREFCLLTECLPDAPNADRVNAMLHGNSASGAPLVRQLFGDAAAVASAGRE